MIALISLLVSLATACLNAGLYVAGCGIGQVFLILFTIYILFIFILCCGVVWLLVRKVLDRQDQKILNQWILLLSVIFSLVFLIHGIASLFASESGDDLAFSIVKLFLWPIIIVLKVFF